MIERPGVLFTAAIIRRLSKLCTFDIYDVREHCLSPGRINMIHSLLKINYGLMQWIFCEVSKELYRLQEV